MKKEELTKKSIKKLREIRDKFPDLRIVPMSFSTSKKGLNTYKVIDGGGIDTVEVRGRNAAIKFVHEILLNSK